MRSRIGALLLVACLTPLPAGAQTTADTGLVDLHTIEHSIRLPAVPILVTPGVAAALARVARRLATGGVGLEVVRGKDVATAHDQGKAVDLRLVDLSRGTPLPMGSEIRPDDGADTVGPGGREARYRGLLSKVMLEEGFVGDSTRWWHYQLSH